MSAALSIAFFGSSLVSSYWNGAATYYRGMLKALARRGHRITFFESDAYERQSHRDIEDPPWARIVVYPHTEINAVHQALEQAREADLIIKASGVGAFDELLEREVAHLRREGHLTAFWDVDAPATLARLDNDRADPFRALIPKYDLVFTYGGGDSVVRRYQAFGARNCHPIYNALDPETHYRVSADHRFECSLAFLGHRLPDREARVEEFFFRPAQELRENEFLLGGEGWGDKHFSTNVRYLGHIYTAAHNAFNSTPLAVLNINRDSMAQTGFSPPTRVFEAAGAGACIITDAWDGIESFLRPQQEILIATDGAHVVHHLRTLTRERAFTIGAAARSHILGEHTYKHRAARFDVLLGISSTDLE